MPTKRTRGGGRTAATVAGGAWALATLVALAVTLSTLGRGDFDGLNNMAQLPLAFPWLLVVRTSGAADPWVLAALGLVNASLIYLVVLWRTVRKSLSEARTHDWPT